MTVTIWHNPRCSKSRQTLALLESKGLSPQVRLYLEDPPSAEELRAALTALGVSADKIVRRGEAEFKAAGLDRESGSEQVFDVMIAYPKLIERPIVFVGERARIGRPPEAVLDLL
ncbi:MAG: arsenate reductase (glutaredoxin) [Paracoccaceae bacterium]